MTLRRRVLAYLALAALASCALTVGVAVVLVKHKISSQRMANLEQQANVVAAAALSPGERVYRVGGGRPRLVRPPRSDAVLAAITASGDVQGSAAVGGKDFLYAARQTAVGGRVVLIRPASLAFAEWRPVLVSLVLAGLGGALLAAVLAYLLARRLTRPIGDLAAATRRVASGEPGVAVPIEGEDELADLGRSFNDMSSELTRARESQRSFLESISHELKTPLTSIRGYAEAIEEHAVTPAEGSRVISSEADRLQRLVTDLLDLARLGRAGFSVAHEPVDLAAIAAQAVQRHLPQARALSVELASNCASGAWAIGDAGRVLQATSNLIENALRLTPAGGSIVVQATAGQIAVRDSGPGLSPQDIAHAFERFYLHDRYRSQRPVGSGLGLAIVRELAIAMGGSVQATIPDGGGAEFVVRLPRGGPAAGTATSQTRTWSSATGNRRLR
ncbi:MAG: HAMP domain-containing histidine kinase [Solirubrobacterales bacterium]|nr:HAMP domain-containing histidine kinase [Solirubrobacterales bacterium]